MKGMYIWVMVLTLFITGILHFRTTFLDETNMITRYVTHGSMLRHEAALLQHSSGVWNISWKSHHTLYEVHLRSERGHKCDILHEDITVVTGFFYLGESFPKGAGFRRSRAYFEWMKSFKLINNPVVAYFDRETDGEYFKGIRHMSKGDRSTIVILDRNKTWAFNLEKSFLKMSNISGDSYPRNRTLRLREYNCIQHGKYELMLRTSLDNPYCTQYIMWLDIGYFLDLLVNSTQQSFSLWLPTGYNHSNIAYTAVRRRSVRLDPGYILRQHKSWLAGGAFLADVTIMPKWALGYMEYVEQVIYEYKAILSDQLTLYGWVNTNTTTMLIQEFHGTGIESWRALGYACRKAGLTRHIRDNSQSNQI